jgi:hypothetical protein
MKRDERYLVQGKAKKGGDFCHKFPKEFVDAKTDSQIRSFYEKSFGKEVIDELLKVKNAEPESKTKKK